MDRFWVPHEELTFAPCWLESRGSKDAIFLDPDKNQVTVPLDKANKLAKVVEAQLVGVDNVCSLEEVNEAALLHTVRVRYLKQTIYTRVARILIAVNPFKALPIFSAQHLEKYVKGSDSMEMPPHIYGIGLDAMNGLRRGDGKNQAVFISGESGAGKTESTKLVMSYVAEALGGAEGGIQDKILRTNPVLEAFGNAMTVRNNNSSRFGKWLQMMVGGNMKIKGCAVIDYLLELTRVCSQGEKERNYHIFFMLLASKKDDLLKDLVIGEPQEYAYLKNAQFKAPGIDDDKCYEELKDAFDGLGYSHTVQTEIFSTTLGILTLGNIEFEDKNDKAEVANPQTLSNTAKLLGIEEEALRGPLLIRKIAVGKDVTEAPRTVAQSNAVRDSLARLLYGRLFKWLIAGINNKLSEGTKLDGQFFGVLDIAGFESFETNSLEQLFINLGNEHLQLFFNNHIFKMELDDYKAEGIPVDSSITFQDNSDIVTLLDSKGAILSILDEEVSMPKATDQTFLSKALKAHDKHPRLIVPKFSGSLKFGIRHFAGDVTYTAENFLDKNVDKPPDEAPALFRSSSLSVLQEVGEKIAAEVAEASGGGGGGRGKKVKTVSAGFRASLASLMALVNTAEPHFIRCVKPNVEKVPDRFTSKIAMEQLLSSGVFEAVRIRQSGYASRTPFREFLMRYRLIVPKDFQAKIAKATEPPALLACVEEFIGQLPTLLEHSMVGEFDSKAVAVGKNKIFAKTATMNALERARDLTLACLAVSVQCKFRGFLIRRKLAGVKVTFGKLNVWCNENKFYSAKGSQYTALAKYKTMEKIEASIAEVTTLLKDLEGLPMAYPRTDHLITVRGRMENEVAALRHLQTVSKSIEPVEIEAALTRAKGLELEGLEAVDALASRAKKLKVQVPLSNAMKKAMEEKSLRMLQEVMQKVKKEGLDMHPEDWIDELKGQATAGEVFNLIEDLKAKQRLEEIHEKEKKELQRKLDAQVQEKQAKFEENVMPKEEVEPPKPKRKATITGFSPEQQDKVKIGLLAAAHEYDTEKLEQGLAEALAQGMDPCDPLAKAQELFDKLQTEAFLTTTLDEMLENRHLQGDTMHAVKCIKNLCDQADKLGLAADAVKRARGDMQQQVRKRARKTLRGDVFFNVDTSEMELVQDAFSNLERFSGLKSADKWRGHRNFLIFSTDSDVSQRLRHSKRELINALTQVPPAMEKRAVANFRALLGWMSDRPMPDCQRLGFAQDIVGEAKSDPAMADEIYVQVMKQLTENPSKRSETEGWKLMLMLCQQVRPGKALDDFVHAFLLKASRNEGEGHEICIMARQCIADLNIITSPEVVMEDNEHLVPIQVSLIDHTTRKLHVPKDSTLEQIAERMAKQLRISAPKDFCFFQLTDGLEMHRLLPESAAATTLFDKWKALEKTSNRSTKLLYKRKFLQVTEALQPGDLMHATLTYKQAVWDFLHYPIPEDVPFVVEISVNIVVLEYCHFERFVQEGTLAQEGVLEQLVPTSCLHYEPNRSQWAAQIIQRLHHVRDRHRDESRLMKMSRIFTLLQRMKLFGVYHWMGRQQMEIPQDCVSIEHAPEQMLMINRKAPKGWYFICVDLFGVRFVSADCTPGNGFQRGFQYSDEALERLLCWGAKKNCVQFVVLAAPDGAGQETRRSPMSLALQSPAAMDISFAIHTVLNHLGLLPQ